MQEYNVLQHTCYRTFLSGVLKDRSAKNPSYSMRAMAKSLDISVAMLSQVLSGKSNLSARSAISIADRLKLSPSERDHFVQLVGGNVSNMNSEVQI